MSKPRFTDEQILQSARVQAGMFVDQHFAQVPIALRAAIQAQPSKAYGRAMATALFDALIERLAEARDEILAEFAETPHGIPPGVHVTPVIIVNATQPAELSDADRGDSVECPLCPAGGASVGCPRCGGAGRVWLT